MNIADLRGDYRVVTAKTKGLQPQQEPKSPDLLQTASDVGGFLFPGTKAIGESLGTIAAAGGRALQGDTAGAQDILSTQKSVPELIGAYTAAGASALGTAGVGTTGGLISKALQSAGIGAAISGGSALSEGKTLPEVGTSAAIGAGVGAGTSLAFSGAEAVLKGFQQLPERLIRSATGQSKAEILAGKDVTPYILQNKKIGSAEQLITQAKTAMNAADTFINESLSSVADKSIPLKDIVGDITTSINSAGGDIDEAGVRTILANMAPQVKKTLEKPTLTLSEANQLRSQLDKVLGNRAFIVSQLPFNKGVLMDVTNALREQVKGNAPEGVRQAFDTLSQERRLYDLLRSKLAGASRTQIIGLGDILSGGFGGAVGGIPGAVAGATLKRVTESTVFKTATAQVVASLDKTLSPVLTGLEPATQTAVINAIVQAFNALEKEDQSEVQ